MQFSRTEIAGFRWTYNPNDQYIGKSLEAYGEWSFGEVELLRGLLNINDTIIEVGSNIGAHTVPLAQHLSVGHVFAFEPQRLCFQMLCANLINNDCTNVTTYHMAVAERDGTTTIPDIDPALEFNFGGVSVSSINSGDAGNTRVVRLDDMIDEETQIALIKCDAEGLEANIVTGASAIIERDKPVLYLEDDKPEYSEELFKIVTALGYDVWWHPVPLFRTENLAANPENIFPRVSSMNILCCHPSHCPAFRGLLKIEGLDSHPLLKSR